ncbi:MAG TPA: hypothetical protein VFV11_05640 [Solimonas sp.]|nr:hypothetical protein [Solimonas sp.]
MNDTLARRAERVRLARLLDIGEHDLEYLDALPVATLRALRERISARLFDQGRTVFEQVAAASRLLPVSLVAKLSEKVFGATLSARIAGFMPPERAIDVSSRLPVEFLGEVCLQLDPRRVAELLRGIPVPLIVQVSQQLAQRGEFVTMGRFVEQLPDGALRAVMDKLSNEQLLRVGLYVESDARLGTVVRFLSAERLNKAVGDALKGGDALRVAGLALIGRVDEPLQRQLATAALRLADAPLVALIQTTRAEQLWGVLIPFVNLLDDEGLRRVFGLAVLREPEVLAEMIAAVDAQDLWAPLIGVLARVDAQLRQDLLEVAVAQDDVLIGGLLEAADRESLWPQLLPLLAAQPAKIQKHIGRRGAGLLGSRRPQLDALAQKLKLWDELVPLRAELDRG